MTEATPTRDEYQARWGAIKARSLAEIGPSLADRFRALPRAHRERILDSLTSVECMRLLHDWRFWARPKQLAPTWAWDVWLLLGGRGSGKSRPAAEFVDEKVRSGQWRTFALIGPDYQHVAKWMIGGEQGKEHNGSGLMDIARPWCRPELIVSKLELRYPNGAIGHITTAEQPEYRGPNLDGGWGDEPPRWRYGERFIQNLELATRAISLRGGRPQLVFTANPANLVFLLRMVMDEGTHVTHMRMRENETNLPASYVARQERKLGGTADGARELEGEPDFFGDESKKLFPMSAIEAHRVDEAPALERIAVCVDPGASTNDRSDPTGIGAIGLDDRQHIFVLADETEKPEPGKGPQRKPEAWAAVAVDLALRLGASLLIAERNKGGDMVLAVVRAELERRRRGGKPVPDLELREVYSVGDKPARAAPVRALYLAGEVHHVGRLADLEDEQTQWEPGMRSPNRLDMLVTSVRALRPDIMEGGGGPTPGATEIKDVLAANREIERSRTRDPLDPGNPGGVGDAEAWTYASGGDFTT